MLTHTLSSNLSLPLSGYAQPAVKRAKPEEAEALAKLRYDTALDDTPFKPLKWYFKLPPARFCALECITNAIKRLTERPEHTILTTNEANAPVGTVELVPYRRPFLQPLLRDRGQKANALIQAFGVEKSRRGKGLGKALLSAAENEAKQQGYDEVMLICSKKNRPMYEHLGYQSVKNPLLKLWLRWPLPNLLGLYALGYPCLMRKALK